MSSSNRELTRTVDINIAVRVLNPLAEGRQLSFLALSRFPTTTENMRRLARLRRDVMVHWDLTRPAIPAMSKIGKLVSDWLEENTGGF
jgi:hypothetical protein